MNRFEDRWKTCVTRARQATAPNEAAPFGFATRVFTAASSQRRREAVTLELVWQRLTLRSLSLIGAVLIVCAIVELPHLRDRRLFEPGIENTVGQIVWSL